jgi:hypothetical protein
MAQFLLRPGRQIIRGGPTRFLDQLVPLAIQFIESAKVLL